MKKNYIFKFILLLIPVAALTLMSNAGGITAARSGSPGDGGTSCAVCHSGGNFNASVAITTNIPSDGYDLNKDYTINVTTSSSSSKHGFQLVAENNSNTRIGQFSAGSGSRVSSSSSGNRITHSTPSASGNWSFTWRSPSTNEGLVTFYSALNATNGNGGTSGDQVVTTSTSANVLSTSAVKRLDFDTYPNPVSDKLSIQLSTNVTEATVQFYDYVGKLAFTKKITKSKQEIDVNDLSSGVYVVKIIADGKVGSKKFIKK